MAAGARVNLSTSSTFSLMEKVPASEEEISETRPRVQARGC